MRFALALTVLAVAALGASQTIDPKITAGDAYGFSMKLDLKVSGADAVVTSKLKFKVASFAEELADIEMSYEDLRAELNGEPQEVPTSAVKMKTDKWGGLRTIDGGIMGMDVPRTLLCAHYLVPKAALKQGETIKETIAKNEKLELGELAIEHKLVGEEEIAGTKTLKVEYKMVESSTKFTVENTVWVTTEGKVMRIEGKFSNLPVPIAGDVAEGTLKLDRSPN